MIRSKVARLISFLKIYIIYQRKLLLHYRLFNKFQRRVRHDILVLLSYHRDVHDICLLDIMNECYSNINGKTKDEEKQRTEN
jgi:hypothetical protein